MTIRFVQRGEGNINLQLMGKSKLKMKKSDLKLRKKLKGKKDEGEIEGEVPKSDEGTKCDSG